VSKIISFLLVAIIVGSQAKAVVDVCILGAGASGMHTAWMLKDKGRDVLLFEKTNEIGGACDTRKFKYPNGTDGFVDPGVVVFPNTTLADALGYGPWGYSMEDIVKRFAGADAPVPSPFTNESDYLANLETGEDYGNFTPNIGPEFFAAVFSLLTIMATEYRWMDTFVNVPPTIPAELLLPFDQWLELRGLTPLAALFNITLFYGGFGEFSSLNAITALVQVGTLTDTMYQLNNGWFSTKRGCMGIYDGIADYLGRDKILLNANVVQVLRNGNGPIRVHYKLGNDHATHVQKCNKLVVAFPPTLDNLQAFTLSQAEANLFGGVYLHQLTVALANISGPLNDHLQAWALQNTDPTRPFGHPVLPAVCMIYRYTPGGPAIYNGIGLNPPISQSQLEAIMRADAAMLPPTLITQTNYTEFFPHNYAPTFPTAKLAETPNPFLQLDALQGQQDTFWVGSLRSTATTAYIIMSIMELLNRNLI